MILASSRFTAFVFGYEAHPANCCRKIEPNPSPTIAAAYLNADSSAPITPFRYARPVSVEPVSPFITWNRRRFNKSSTNCHKKRAQDLFEDFSVLSSDIPWEAGNIWSTMAAYFFSFHIPLSFGGLSVISWILHQPVLDPLTESISVLLFQAVEFMGALALFHYTARPNYGLSSFFQQHSALEQRDWIKSSAVALGLLFLLVILTSFFADMLVGPKDVNNAVLKEILSSSPAAKVACFFLYCLITPLMEETVYRGFLLTSLASMMTWRRAVVISSFVFSLAHFSCENSVPLFLIGCVLGSVYCWTGNIAASVIESKRFVGSITKDQCGCGFLRPPRWENEPGMIRREYNELLRQKERSLGSEDLSLESMSNKRS